MDKLSNMMMVLVRTMTVILSLALLFSAYKVHSSGEYPVFTDLEQIPEVSHEDLKKLFAVLEQSYRACQEENEILVYALPDELIVNKVDEVIKDE